MRHSQFFWPHYGKRDGDHTEIKDSWTHWLPYTQIQRGKPFKQYAKNNSLHTFGVGMVGGSLMEWLIRYSRQQILSRTRYLCCFLFLKAWKFIKKTRSQFIGLKFIKTLCMSYWGRPPLLQQPGRQLDTSAASLLDRWIDRAGVRDHYHSMEQRQGRAGRGQ